jgi:hypothetical protein
MTIKIRPYAYANADEWDAFCDTCLQATLLHTRLFLSYHGDRFEDKSLIIEKDGKCLGLFPTALSPVDAKTVVSHPGVTYGGLIHQGGLRGELMIQALEVIRQHYADQRLSSLVYKAVPTFYHQAPAQDDLYALFRLGAKRIRFDISSTIDLQHRLPVSERRRRNLKKATRAGVIVVQGHKYLGDLWNVLSDNLQRKHGVAPVHSLAEIQLLAERFPQNILCVCAEINGEIEAGVVLFVTPTVHHAQYIASSNAGYGTGALDAIFCYCISTAEDDRAKWFDFGISTEDSGTLLNSGLFKFKSEFGSGSTAHEFFEISLVT